MFNFWLILFLQPSHADFRFSFDSILTAQKNEVIDSSINSLNKVLKLPDDEVSLDLRSELKWRLSQNQILLRPRLLSHFQRSTDFQTDQVASTDKSDVNLTDAFIETNWTSFYSTTIGVQVYQWGPTEFLNSSNPFFHFNSKQKSLFYKEKGQVLIRNNISIDKDNNIVLSLMPVSNNESQWIEGDEFVPKALIKYEKSWSGTFNAVGFVVGTEEKKNVFLGQYFNYSFLESASLYADLKQSQYKINFEPVAKGASYDLEYLNNTQDQWLALVDVGLRWESDFDLRFEYIHNAAGFDQTELKQVFQSASNVFSPRYATNLKRFLKPGLEVLGRNYLYASLRITDPFSFKDLNLYSRGLYSMQDQSSQIQFEFDKSFADNFNLFANQTLSYGTDDSEFRLQNSWSFLLGLKYSL